MWVSAEAGAYLKRHVRCATLSSMPKNAPKKAKRSAPRAPASPAPSVIGDGAPLSEQPGVAAAATPQPVRRVQRLSAQARLARGNSLAAELPPLDPTSAAIPFERVPYVPADLRRVAVMALLMIVVIVAAAFVVPHIVGG